jgi:hypothetical protein
MHQMNVALFSIAVVGIVVGQWVRGAPLLGLILGAVVMESAWEWWRLRSGDGPVRDVADRLGLSIALLAVALAGAAPWQIVEDWIAGLFG